MPTTRDNLDRAPGSSGASTATARGASASRPPDSNSAEEARAFLQRRISGFALLVASLNGGFLVWRLISLLVDPGQLHGHYLAAQIASVAVFVILWLATRTGQRSPTLLATLEATTFILGSLALMVMALGIPYEARPDYILILALGAMLVVRAIYVPCSFRGMALLGLAVGIPLVVCCYAIHRIGHDPAIYTARAPALMRRSPADLAATLTIADALMWAMWAVIAAAASRVIYGLRAEVRDARRLGQYTLLEKLGQGGMGVVYRASHAMLRRPTAVKLLAPDKLGEDSVARFEREVQLTARLTHPNTIRVFDYGRTPDGVFYYAMEFLDGASLAEVVRHAGPLPPARVIHILMQIAGALAEAHGIGLIHRDIKPANVLLTEQGGIADVAKVLDFGLVKEVAGAGGPQSASAVTIEALTQNDSFAGTPQYMAPEAITSPDRVDARADLYALGAVGYFLLTGQDVFTGATVLEVCSHHLHSTPVPPGQRSGRPVPDDLAEIVLSCLAKDPSERPADARALAHALARCRDRSGWDEEQARDWWQRHGGDLRTGARSTAASVTDAAVGGMSTIAVAARARG